MQKLVSKALANLMAHFTFLFLIILTLCLFYVDVMLASCKLEISQTIDGFRVARTRGTMRWTQRFERRGLNV
jgi:hypothetical protein